MTAAHRILVVDDDSACLGLVCRLVKEGGYAPVSASSGRDAVYKAKTFRPALIVLDLAMPAMNGFEVCQLLKADARTRRIPVLFMTGVSDKSNLLRTASLSCKGGDFIRKPFSIKRLQARIQRLLAPATRAAGASRRGSSSSRPKARLRLDPDTRQVRLGGRVIARLGPRQLQLMRLLRRHKEGVLRETLRREGWGDGGDTKTVDRTVARLRKTLGAAGKSAIVSIPGGYKLVR